jgi:aminodeoxyfutalosine deaminase
MSIPVTPKIELHVHLEGSVRPPLLFEIAKRNGFHLPAEGEAELAKLFEFRDFDHFLALWLATTPALQTEDDFRRIVVAYAQEAATFGAVYIEGIFTPVERTAGGAGWDEVFSGFCDGATEARERLGVEVRLTPDIPRNRDLEAALQTARYAVKYRERGVVGLGLGGPEAQFPPEPFEPAFRLAKEGGLGSVPHAGEAAGPESVRGALDALQADRIRHGVRSVEDRGLLDELVSRRIVCDVCPISNVRTRVVDSIGVHPLATMLEAGVLCSISTDDPAMFETDLARDYQAAAEAGCTPEQAYTSGLAGALCDDETRERLRQIQASYTWSDSTPPGVGSSGPVGSSG